MGTIATTAAGTLIPDVITPTTITGGSYPSRINMPPTTAVEIGLIRHGSNTIDRVIVDLPTQKLVNGHSPSNLRTTRLNRFMNLLHAYAKEQHGYDPNVETFTFIRIIPN